MEEAYKFVRGKVLLTMNEKENVIKGGVVVLKDNIIHDYGPYDAIHKKYSELMKIRKCTPSGCMEGNFFDYPEGVVMPGIVTAHTHHFQSLMKGIGSDLNLDDWVLNVIFPMGMAMGEEETEIAGLLNMMEMIRTGTTCFADSQYMIQDDGNMKGLVHAVEKSGIRGILCRATQGMKYDPRVPDGVIEDVKTALAKTEECIDKYHNTLDGRLKIGVEAITPIDCSGEMIRELKNTANKHDTLFQMHTAETYGELQTVKCDHKMGIIEYLDSLGVLDSHTMLIHGVWMSAKERKLLADRDVKIAHNPVANMILGDGVAKIPELKAMGVTVGIGVDGAASNNNQDMFEAMKTCALLHRVHNMDASVFNQMDVLKMATIDSARAIGLEKEVGSIEVGKKADVIVVDTNSLSNTPNAAPVTSIVFSGNGRDVNTVFVDGKLIMEDKKFTHLDEEVVKEKARKVTERLLVESNVGEHVSII